MNSHIIFDIKVWPNKKSSWMFVGNVHFGVPWALTVGLNNARMSVWDQLYRLNHWIKFATKFSLTKICSPNSHQILGQQEKLLKAKVYFGKEISNPKKCLVKKNLRPFWSNLSNKSDLESSQILHRDFNNMFIVCTKSLI